MSFICQGCKEPQLAGTRANKVVTQKRRKMYGGVSGNPILGWEVVVEKLLCVICAGNAVEAIPQNPPELNNPSLSQELPLMPMN